MFLRARFAVLAASLLASACVVVPRTRDGYDPECEFVTHHMELETIQVAQMRSCGDDLCRWAVVVAVGVTAASAVVSSSIVLVGNVVYWADRRISCGPPTVAAAAPRP